MVFVIILLIGLIVVLGLPFMLSANEKRREKISELDLIDKLRGVNRHHTSSTGPH